jgi:pimeloyl-ACP methyl ester carboxylesterase
LRGGPGGSDHTVFKPMFSQFTDIAQVLYPDMAGCGRSEGPVNGEYSIESWAGDVAELCVMLGIKKPIVLGNSAGRGLPRRPLSRSLGRNRAGQHTGAHHPRTIARDVPQARGEKAVQVARKVLIEVCDLLRDGDGGGPRPHHARCRQ